MDKYVSGIPRVSNIVEFKYPFSVEDKTRFLEWLYHKGITEGEYMNIATTWGTIVHNNLEKYILGHKMKNYIQTIQKEIDLGKKYIDDLKNKYPTTEWEPEQYIIDKYNRFQGTCDLVRINGNKVFLYDYKTYEISKKRFGMTTKLLKSGRPGKPTYKIKKVSLQLSLYAQYFIQQGYEIGGLYLVWIHDSGVWEYECELWQQEDIDKLLINFLTKDIMEKENIELKINAPFKIHLQTSPVAYGNISVDLDLSELDSGITPEEAINQAILLQKKLHQCYIPKEQQGE